MITLPEDFVPTKYTGYYWSVTEKYLYTCKGGTLKPLKRGDCIVIKGVRYPPGWFVSHEGRKYFYPEGALLLLSPRVPDSEFPTRRQNETPRSS